MGQTCGCQLSEWQENEELSEQFSSRKRSASQRSGIFSPSSPQKRLKPKMFKKDKDCSLTLAVECVDGDSSRTPSKRQNLTPLSKSSSRHNELLRIDSGVHHLLPLQDHRASSAQTKQSNSNFKFGIAGPRPTSRPRSNRGLKKLRVDQIRIYKSLV